MDKLQAISVFVKIAEKGSLTAAAESLGKSLPAVVRALAALEDKLQVRLFNRTTRKIALTEEGRVYLEHCRKILLDIEESERLLGQDQHEPHGSITITAPVRFGEMYVAPAVVRFMKQYPRVQVKLMLLDRITNLLDEGVDLAVRIAHLEDSSLIARHIGDIRQVVCGSPGLIKSTGRPDRPELLADLPCVYCSNFSSGLAWRFRENGKRLDVRVNSVFTSNLIRATVDACIAGLGFGMFFNYQVNPWVLSGELEMVLNDYSAEPLPLSLVYPHSRLMTTRVRAMIDWLAKDLKTSLSDLE